MTVKKAEVVAQKLRETPPAITGIMDGHRYRRFVRTIGEGSEKKFWFDGDVSLSFRELVHRAESVVLDGNVKFVRMSITFGRSKAPCPACGQVLTVGSVWWLHYNSAHALRPSWLNREDWEKIVDGPYQPPPELL